MAGVGEILIGLAISTATSVITSMLAPKQKLLPVDKGRFDDIRVQGSEYGTSIPMIYGRARLAGNIIFSDGVQPWVTTTPGRSGGKGLGGGRPAEPPTNNYTYTTNIAVAICEGPVLGGLKRIWENTKVTQNMDASPLPSGTQVEAELTTNTFAGGAVIVRDLSASAEYKVFLPNNGSEVLINNIIVNEAGLMDIKVLYMGLGAKQCEVFVDGVTKGQISFSSTGGDSVGSTKIIQHTFTAGVHTIKFKKSTGSPAPYIDAVGVYGAVATATAAVSGGLVTSITVGSGGGGYNSPPRISFVGDGQGATATASVSVGAVTSITVNSGGTGYTTAPSVIISPSVSTTPVTVTGIVDPDGYYPSNLDNPSDYYNARFIPDDITGTAIGKQYNPSLSEDDNPDDPTENPPPGTPGTGGSGTSAFTFYNGSETQTTDPMMESIDVGQVPAYRGVSYVTFKNYQIPDGQMPNFTFEVDEGTHDLADIVSSLWKRVGLEDSQLNVVDLEGTFVEGLVIQSRTALTDILDTLSIAFAFDFVDLDGKITAVKRGKDSIVTITEAEMRAHEDGSEPPISALEGSYTNIEELPRQIDVSYIDRAKEYHQNVQPALKQIGFAEEPQTLTLPIVLSANQAQEIGLRVLHTIHLQRAVFGFSLPPKFSYLSPTDIVTVQVQSGGSNSLQTFNYGLSNLGTVATASSSHVSGNFPVSSVIEGNRRATLWGASPADSQNGWNSASNPTIGAPDWVELNFGQARKINEINIFSVATTATEPHANTLAETSSNTLQDFDVQYWNGSIWVDIANVTGNDRTWRQFKFSDITTQHIRVYITAALDGFARIAEIEAIGNLEPSIGIVTHKLRILQFQTGMPGMCKVQAVADSPSLYENILQGDTGSGSETPIISFPSNSELTLMDIAPLFPEHTGFGFYAAACGRGAGDWYGAHLYREEILDSGTYARIGGFEVPATMGDIPTNLSNSPSYTDIGGGNMIDTTSSITVRLFFGTLESFTNAELFANPSLNLAYIGGEVVQFATATSVQSDVNPYLRQYTLSNFRRGLNGTTAKIGTHSSGERFVLFNNAVKFMREQSSQLYLNSRYKAVSIGQPLNGANTVVFNTGAGSAPPLASNLILSQVDRTSPEGIAFIAIRGTFDFGYYVGGQKAKVLLIRPSTGGVYHNTGILVSPDANNTGSFEVPAAVNGTYTIKIVPISPYDHQQPEPPNTHEAASIAITADNPTPATPSTPVPDFDGQMVTWRWTATTDSRHSYYQVYDGNTNTVLPDATRVDGNQYVEYPVDGIQRKVRAVSNQGTPSILSAAGTFNIPAPSIPVGYTMVFDGTSIIHAWTPEPAYSYDIGNVSFAVIGSSRTGQWIETSPPSSRSIVRYIRSNQYGAVSAWEPVGGLTLSIPAPPSPTSVTFDTASATPFDINVLIQKPAGITDRRFIRYTVVEVLKNSDLSTVYTMTFEGLAESALISGRFSSAGLSTIKVKAHYVDFVGAGSTTTSSASYTFPTLVGTDLGNAILDTSHFASTIRPVQIYSASTTVLPTLPNSLYPTGSYLYWTNPTNPLNKHLWRVDAAGTSWVTAIDAVDIVANSITAGQIAAGAIGADQIAARSIRADKLAVGVLQDNLIVNSSFESFSPVPYNASTSRPTGWAMVENSSGTPDWNVSTTQFAEGSYSLRMQGAAANFNIASTAIPVSGGQKYVIRAKFKSSASSGNFGLYLNEYNTALADGLRYIGNMTSGDIISRTSATTPTDTNGAALYNIPLSGLGADFVTKEIVYTVPSGVQYVSLAVFFNSGNAPLYIDAVDFRKEITGVLIENGTITAQNLVIGGMTDNLLSNSSFEQLDENGYPATWGYYAAVGSTSYTIPGTVSRAISINSGQGTTSRVIPVVPGQLIAVRWAQWSPNAGSTQINALFRTTMPSTGTERIRNYIGNGSDGASAYNQFIALGTPSLTTSPTYHEGTFTVPSNRYFLAFSPTTSASSTYIDDISIKQRVGQAFITDLRADQIVANVGQFGLVFADQIRQSSYTPYQLGSVHSPQNAWDYTLGTTTTYDLGTDTIEWTGSTAWDTTSTVVTQAWQKIETGTNGYFEFTITELNSNHSFMAGLTGNFNPATYGSGNYHQINDYCWFYNGSTGSIYVREYTTSVFDAGIPNAGDVYRVGIEDGNVKFRKNGKLIYTSPRKPTIGTLRTTAVTPVNADYRGLIIFASLGGTPTIKLLAPKLVQEGFGQGWRLNPLTGSSIFSDEPIWDTAYDAGTISSDLNIGSMVQKSGGGASAFDTSVVTEQTIAAGDGWFQAAVTNDSKRLFFGITSNASWINPAISTVSFAIQALSNIVKVFESGSDMGTMTTSAVGDVFRVSIEGNIVKYRKNGAVFYESTVTPITYPLRGKVCLYEPDTLVNGLLFTASSSGAGEFNSGITVRGQRLEDTVKLATQAVRQDNRYRGNDYTVPSNQITSISSDTYFTVWEDDMSFMTLSVTVSDYKSNATKNMDSLRSARVRVYNKFGEVVKQVDSPWAGRGNIFSGFIPRAHTDLQQEAVFSLEFENLYGYSRPVWYSEAGWMDKGGSTWIEAPQSPNISYSQPEWFSVFDIPTKCTAIPLTTDSVRVSWINAANYPSAAHQVYYRLYKADGYEGYYTAYVENMTGTGGTRTLTVNGQTTSALNHNASKATVITALEALSSVDVGEISVSGVDTSGDYTYTFNGNLINTHTSMSVTPASLTGGTSVLTEYLGGWIPFGSTVTTGTKDVTGLQSNVRYEFMAQSTSVIYGWSNYAYCRTFLLVPTVSIYGAPSTLSGASVSTSQINLSWVKNDGAGYTKTEIFYVVGVGTPTDTDTQLGSGFTGTSTNHTSLATNTTYSYRARNNYNAGANYSDWSNTITVTTQASSPPTTVPTNVGVTAVGYYAIRVNWTANGGATTHRVQLANYYDTTFSSPIHNANTADGSGGKPRVIGGLLSGADYRARVSGDNGANWSVVAFGSTNQYDENDTCILETETVISINPQEDIVETDALDVKIGDRLLGTDTLTGKTAYGSVKHIIKAKTSMLYHVITTNGNSLYCSRSHKLITNWSDYKGTSAYRLNIGDGILTYDKINNKIVQDTISEITYEVGVYNVITFHLESEDHTYIARGILSHNRKAD